MDRILIFGGRGYLGTIFGDYFRRIVGLDVIRLSSRVDIRSKEKIVFALKQYKPDLVMNLAGTPSTAWCEEHPHEAFDINTAGAINVVESCIGRGVGVIHFSDGNIFSDNKRAYKETDPPRPSTIYAQSKAEADVSIKRYISKGESVLLIRPRQVFSVHSHPKNPIDKFLLYDTFFGFSDEGSFTSAEELVIATEKIIDLGIARGEYNICNPGKLSPLELCYHIRRLLKPEMCIQPISYNDFVNKAKTEKVSALLSTSRLARIGIKLSPIYDSVMRTLRQRCHFGQYSWQLFAPGL